ncbi:MAG: AI-2E family transporter [Novipirellula sp. JB048]
MNRHPLIFALLLLLLVLAVAKVLVITASVVLVIFAGLMFGILLNRTACWLAGYAPIPYHGVYFIVVAALLALSAAGVYYLGAQIAQQADELSSQLRDAAQQASERISQYEIVQRYSPDESEMQSMVTDQGGAAVLNMLQGVRSLAWTLTALVVIFFVGLYAAYEPNLYRTGLVKLFPLQRRERVQQALDELRGALSRWITGRLMSMAVVGVLTAIGLGVLEVPLFLTLGVLAALLTFIPNFGPLLAMVPQLLLALNVGPHTVWYVLGLNLALQGIESYLITPMIQRQEVALPPILTIAAQLLMGVWVGVIGVMMAAPLVVMAMVLIQLFYIRDRLGDPNPGELTSD